MHHTNMEQTMCPREKDVNEQRWSTIASVGQKPIVCLHGDLLVAIRILGKEWNSKYVGLPARLTAPQKGVGRIGSWRLYIL